MANYLIDSMQWSYSRLTTYEMCPYKFYLHYIEGLEEEPMFLSSYGSLMHRILASVYAEGWRSERCVTEYLTRFRAEVQGRPPTQAVFDSLFNGGLEALKHLRLLPGAVTGVEKQVSFQVDGYPFTGIIDLKMYTGTGFEIVDHKTKVLKPRSKRKKPTKSDRELDSYLRQLYLYAISMWDSLGAYPENLVFNCFRGEVVREGFDPERLGAVKQWAIDTIHAIERERRWQPNPEYFTCHNLCGLRKQCVYADMMI